MGPLYHALTARPIGPVSRKNQRRVRNRPFAPADVVEERRTRCPDQSVQKRRRRTPSTSNRSSSLDAQRSPRPAYRCLSRISCFNAAMKGLPSRPPLCPPQRTRPAPSPAWSQSERHAVHLCVELG